MKLRNAETPKRLMRKTHGLQPVGIVAALMILGASTAWAQTATPTQTLWTRVYLNGQGDTFAPPELLNTGLGTVLQVPQTNFVTVTITAKAPITRAMFVLDAGADGEAYYPHLMGLRIDAAWLANKTEWDWQGDESPNQRFPGLAFAPLVAHYAQAGGALGTGRLVADVEGRNCQPLYTKNRLALVYQFDPPLAAGNVATFRHLIATTRAATGRGAMQNLLRAFTKLVPDDGEYPELQPLNGYLHMQLVDLDAPLQHVARLWADHGETFRRALVWGWTSGRYAPPLADARGSVTEETGCCLKRSTLHPRYAGIDDLARMITARGGSVAWYYRADDASLDFDAIRRPAYIDVAAFLPGVLPSYGATDTIVEGLSVRCKHAGLVGGSVSGGTTRLPGGTLAHEVPVPWFGALVFSSDIPGKPGRPKFLGDSNFDWHWTDEAKVVCPQCKTRHAFQTYRAALLLGCKLDVRDPGQPIIQAIVAEWNASKFWERRPAYLDTIGVGGIPENVAITRFRDKDGKTLLAVDRWMDAEWNTPKTVRVDGVMVTLPGKRLAIAEKP